MPNTLESQACLVCCSEVSLKEPDIHPQLVALELDAFSHLPSRISLARQNHKLGSVRCIMVFVYREAMRTTSVIQQLWELDLSVGAQMAKNAICARKVLWQYGQRV